MGVMSGVSEALMDQLRYTFGHTTIITICLLTLLLTLSANISGKV